MTEIAAPVLELYAAYHRASSIVEKAMFFSPECTQICDTHPLYGAQSRDTIVRYLEESATSRSGIDVIDRAIESCTSATKSYYTIRPVLAEEHTFGTNEGARVAGFASTEEVYDKSRAEGWAGARVDLRIENGTNLGGPEDGLLVRVRYWWRKEGGKWLQILHHILYLGPLNGEEASQGAVLG